MKKKKIVFIMNNFWIGGVERLLFDLVTKLCVTNDVEIVAVLGSGPLEFEFKKVPVHVYHANPVFFTDKKLPFKLFWLINAPITLLRLIFFLIKVKPDVVVTSLYQADVLGILGAWICGVKKRILIQHDVQKFGFLRKYFKFFLALSPATCIVGVSSAVKKFLVSYWHIPQNKVIVINNGINMKKFENVFKSLNEKEIVFGVLGRLEPVKGHIYLLQALKILKKEGVEPKVILAGNGTLREDLEEFVKENALHEVEFLGSITDTLHFFELIDVLVVPSLEEGFGLVALEGLAAKKVIIASDIDVFQELAGKEEILVLFDKGKSKKLADALSGLIKKPLLLHEYQHKIESWIKSTSYQYDIEYTKNKYEEVFK